MSIFAVRRRAPTHSAFSVLFWWTFVPVLLRCTFVVFYRLRLIGAAHVPRRGPVLFVANHQSHYDPVVVGCLVADRPFASLARATLFASRFFTWLIRQCGAIPLRLGRADKAAMRAAIRELQGGGCVLLFPEGTRSGDGGVARFRPGMLALVARARAPVVPVAVEGPYDIWPKGREYPKLRGRIMVQAGPAIAAEELLDDRPEVAKDRLRREIARMRLELRSELRRRSGGRYPAPGPGDRSFQETSKDE